MTVLQGLLSDPIFQVVEDQVNAIALRNNLGLHSTEKIKDIYRRYLIEIYAEYTGSKRKKKLTNPVILVQITSSAVANGFKGEPRIRGESIEWSANFVGQVSKDLRDELLARKIKPGNFVILIMLEFDTKIILVEVPVPDWS